MYFPLLTMFRALSKMDRKKKVAYRISGLKYPRNINNDKKKMHNDTTFKKSRLATESSPTGRMLNAVSKTINEATSLLLSRICMQ